MELTLIRHAQPAWRQPDGLASNDPGLTGLGDAQATALAEHLAATGRRIDQLISSPAVRSQDTARAIAEHLELEIVTQDWMLEVQMPDDWEGIPEDMVVEALSEFRTRPLDRWWDGHDGGESFRGFHDRITAGLDGFLERYGVLRHHHDPARLWDVPDESPHVMLVAHAGTNSVIISHLLGIEPQPYEWERFPCDHASISVMRSRAVAGADMWALEHFSEVGHLAGVGVSS